MKDNKNHQKINNVFRDSLRLIVCVVCFCAYLFINTTSNDINYFLIGLAFLSILALISLSNKRIRIIFTLILICLEIGLGIYYFKNSGMVTKILTVFVFTVVSIFIYGKNKEYSAKNGEALYKKLKRKYLIFLPTVILISFVVCGVAFAIYSEFFYVMLIATSCTGLFIFFLLYGIFKLISKNYFAYGVYKVESERVEVFSVKKFPNGDQLHLFINGKDYYLEQVNIYVDQHNFDSVLLDIFSHAGTTISNMCETMKEIQMRKMVVKHKKDIYTLYYIPIKRIFSLYVNDKKIVKN